MIDTAIVIMSCDLYEDAWNPFFKLMSLFWENLDKPVFLVTENKEYCCPYMKVSTIKTGVTSWSRRVKHAIAAIGCKYFYLFLEDFFLMSSVDENTLAQAEGIIKNNADIGLINFIPDLDGGSIEKSFDYEKNNKFKIVPKENEVRVTAVSSLWKTEYLMKVIREKESPWDFEALGSIRSKKLSEKILWHNNKSYGPVFDYHYLIRYGYGITQKHWLPKNKELFEKYDIDVDFSKLGFLPQKSKNREKRSKKELLMLIFTNPNEIIDIIINKFKSNKSIKKAINYIKANV